MAPEVGKCGDYDQKCDIYSLGLIIYEIWEPFKTETLRRININKLKNYCHVSKEFKHKNAKQAEMIDRMIFKDPKDRINSYELLNSNLIPDKSDEEILHDALKILKLPKSSVAFKNFITHFFNPISNEPVFKNKLK